MPEKTPVAGTPDGMTKEDLLETLTPSVK